MKAYIFTFIVIFILCLKSDCQTYLEYTSFSTRRSFDTLVFDKTISIRNQVIFQTDTITIFTSFKKDTNDFSFYYADLWDTTQIFFNSNFILPLNGYEPYFHRYLSGYDSVILFQRGDIKHFVILGEPFFCNGRYCSNLSALVLVIQGDLNYCFEFETNYDNYKLLRCNLITYFNNNKRIRVNRLSAFLNSAPRSRGRVARVQ